MSSLRGALARTKRTLLALPDSRCVFLRAMKLPELRPRQPLSGVALSAALGILVADRFAVPIFYALAAGALACCVPLARPRTWNCWLLSVIAFAVLHTLHHRHSDSQRLASEFSDGNRLVRATGVVWSEPEKPAFWSRDVTARFRLKLESIEIAGQMRNPAAFVNVNWAGAMPAYGDRVKFTASARNLEPPRNPGQLDFTRYLQRQGIFSELSAHFAGDCLVTDHGHGERAQLFAISAQHWVRARLERDLADSPEISALIESMILGLQGETPEDEKQMFQRTGTMHLFAVSGLNVAMLATIAWFLLKPLRIGRKASVVLIVPMLAGYALVTGLSASCVRATIMGALVLVAILFDRPGVVYNSLAAAALGILAWDTNQLFIPGFQFSFVLVFTIVWLARRIQIRCEPLGHPDAFLPRLLWNRQQRFVAWSWSLVAAAIGVTLSAWIGSLIFTAGYFHLFSPAGILANLLAVPLAFVVLALGVATLLVAPVWAAGAIWFNNANWLCAKALLYVVRVFALLPGGHIYVELPALAAKPACEFTVFDLGEGGATHLRAGGRDWLLDCGHVANYPRTILPYLRSRGVNRLDGLLLTHGDARHIGAALDAVNDFAPRVIADSPLKDRSSARESLHAEMAAKPLGKRILSRGDTIPLPREAEMRVLFPPPGLVRNTADDKALVVRLECAGRRVLFMSDSGFATEQWLIQNEPDLRADLLVKGQHSKDFSGTLEFLSRVQPAAVISSAPLYGLRPEEHDEWARKLAEKGIAVFRQEQCGAAQVEIRDGQINVRGFANGQAFHSKPRDPSDRRGPVR